MYTRISPEQVTIRRAGAVLQASSSGQLWPSIRRLSSAPPHTYGGDGELHGMLRHAYRICLTHIPSRQRTKESPGEPAGEFQHDAGVPDGCRDALVDLREIRCANLCSFKSVY